MKHGNRLLTCCPLLNLYFYARLDHTFHTLCLAARSTHLAPDWLLLLLFCLVVFVDVVVVVLSLGSYHYPEPPSPQSPQRDPLGHAH